MHGIGIGLVGVIRTGNNGLSYGGDKECLTFYYFCWLVFNALSANY